MNKKPLILITNDDGVSALGIKALIDVSKKIGTVVVVAPNKPQSGMGHAVTLNSTLRINKYKENGVVIYSTSGTPVDCVKLAVNEILHQKPDILLSGINHGLNSSINVLYSGTMSAAVEGAIEGIPSIGFSLDNYSVAPDFTASKFYAKKIIEQILKNKMSKKSCLNINIPNVSTDKIAGIKICKQADARWEEKFEKRIDPSGEDYYWLSGKLVRFNNNKNSDLYALKKNYISIVPTKYDMTDYESIDKLEKYNFD